MSDNATRDYQAWHDQYGDPASLLPWRLGVVQGWLRDALDRTSGPVRVVSACSGDGRDILGVLAERDDRARVSTTLVEAHPGIADAARARVAELGLDAVTVRTADAGVTDAYVGAVPAAVVLLVGIFGNISDEDVAATIAAAPALCAPGATVLWSRSRGEVGDLDAQVRDWFRAAGFTELDHATRDDGGRPAVGVVRYDGPAVELVPGRRLFSFIR